MEQANAQNQPEQPELPIPIATKNYAYPLVWSPHMPLTPVAACDDMSGGIRSTFYTRGYYAYFNCGCDGVDDTGWGAGYRTLQTITSWIYIKRDRMTPTLAISRVPSIYEIQHLIIKNSWIRTLRNPPDWIGTIEVFFFIEKFYDVKCRVMHISNHMDLKRYASVLKRYFQDYGGIGLISGDRDTKARCIAGVHIKSNQAYLLLIDHSFVGRARNAQELIAHGKIRWKHTTEFVDSSFYNICLPLVR